MPAFRNEKLTQQWKSWFKWKQSQHKQKFNPNQTHSPIVHQHVKKDAPFHAPGPLSFLQLWSSSCTSCIVPIKQQVKKKAYLRSVNLRIFWLTKKFAICSNLRTILRHVDFRTLFLAKQFAKQIESYLCELKTIWHIFARQPASQKVSQTVLCDSTETNLCRKKMEGKECTYKCCFEAGNATLP